MKHLNNIQRSSDYINLAHKIRACNRRTDLRNLTEVVLLFVNETKDESEATDLIDLYDDKEKTLDINFLTDYLPFPTTIFGNNVSKIKTV